MTVKDNLIAARALIDTPEKWGKGQYETFPGRYCLYGASFVGRGAPVSGDNLPSLEDWALVKALPSLAKTNGGVLPDVTRFNDHPGTTHEMAMAVMDRAIDACDHAPAS